MYLREYWSTLIPTQLENRKNKNGGDATKEYINRNNNQTINHPKINITNDHMTQIRRSVHQHWNSGDVVQHVDINILAWKLGMSISPFYCATQIENPLKYNLPKAYYNPDFLHYHPDFSTIQ